MCLQVRGPGTVLVSRWGYLVTYVGVPSLSRHEKLACRRLEEKLSIHGVGIIRCRNGDLELSLQRLRNRATGLPGSYVRVPVVPRDTAEAEWTQEGSCVSHPGEGANTQLIGRKLV